MNVLLSIKPQYAELIFKGQKKYEFRRSIFKRDDINKIIVYASSPVCKVIGEFVVGEVIADEIQALWKKTMAHAGISKNDFFGYFANKDFGYAIKIRKHLTYSSPVGIKEAFGISPPQSFAYVEDSFAAASMACS